MSVLIKGMEMPTEGEYNMTLYVCSDGSAYMDVASFPVDKDKFEAVPVPPHGDLIERKAVLNKFSLHMNRTMHYVTIRDTVPTIIPAEEDE